MQVFCCQVLWAADEAAWNVDGLNVHSHDGGVVLRADALSWGEAWRFEEIELDCRQKEVMVFPMLECMAGEVRWQMDQGEHVADINLSIDHLSKQYQLELSHETGLQVSMGAGSNDLVIQLEEASVAELLALVLDQSLPVDLTLNGGLALDTSTGRIHAAEALQFKGLSYEHSDDVIFMGLSGSAKPDIQWTDRKIVIELHVTSGEALINQVYLDFSQFPMQFIVQSGSQNGSQQAFHIKAINQASLEATATATLDHSNFDVWFSDADLSVIDSHHFNQQVLDGVLGFYGFDQSQMSGQFAVDITFTKGGLPEQVTLSFNDYFVKNANRKIDVQGLDGQVNWSDSETAAGSFLSWSSALLAGLPVAASEASFQLEKDGMRLSGAHQFPVFDGSIILNELHVGSILAGEIHPESLNASTYDLSLDAEITPISLKLITAKLGWPEMAGTISGRIPGLTKKGRVIELLGALDVSVFCGDMTVNNLSMERLFGVAPVIAGDVVFDGFDLSLLTETFGFGRITGKLSGTVNQLRITDWKTDRLDATVYTVKNPDVKQTISQRAVDNISSLGGIKGSVSRTFLRFFDDFKYKNIRLSCKLHNSVCQIGGLKNQDNQFVIVEGGGIPKINIVGYVRSINWETFISRLLNANYE